MDTAEEKPVVDILTTLVGATSKKDALERLCDIFQTDVQTVKERLDTVMVIDESWNVAVALLSRFEKMYLAGEMAKDEFAKMLTFLCGFILQSNINKNKVILHALMVIRELREADGSLVKLLEDVTAEDAIRIIEVMRTGESEANA